MMDLPGISVAPELPDFPEYYMIVAFAVRNRANCKGYKVGAVLVVQNRVVSTGYNGVPEGMTNCIDGGCDRCSNPQKYRSGEGYDVCICVHAEENALLTAARFGITIDGGTIYSTVKPCFSCMKALHRAGVAAVRYHREWAHPDESLRSQYRAIEAKFVGGVKKIQLTDPGDERWIYPER